MHLRHRLLVGAIVFFAMLMAASASVSDADLQREYGDKVLTLRQFLMGQQLIYRLVPSPTTPGEINQTSVGIQRIRESKMPRGGKRPGARRSAESPISRSA